jgi:hypothetical protein
LVVEGQYQVLHRDICPALSLVPLVAAVRSLADNQAGLSVDHMADLVLKAAVLAKALALASHQAMAQSHCVPVLRLFLPVLLVAFLAQRVVAPLARAVLAAPKFVQADTAQRVSQWRFSLDHAEAH